jgi:acetyl-CoA carboxylase carboxyltransferase component
VTVLHRKELAVADDSDGLRARLVKEYSEEMLHSYYAAERGLVDDVIDPADTRLFVAKALEYLRGKHVTAPPRKHGNPPL